MENLILNRDQAQAIYRVIKSLGSVSAMDLYTGFRLPNEKRISVVFNNSPEVIVKICSFYGNLCELIELKEIYSNPSEFATAYGLETF